MPELIFSLSFFPLAMMALIAISNSVSFPRLKKQAKAPLGRVPKISVLIPMRNEAGIIAKTLCALLNQDYPNLEIIVLDDNSNDNCAEIATQAGQGDVRLRVISGARLPEGWLGKPWACQQLADLAQGDYLLFTDADVRWENGAISALWAEASATHADLLTVWPTQKTVSFAERLVIPLMGFAILSYLPILAVHYLPCPVFSAAMGQCLFFRRAAYRQIGGHARIKNKILDDMACAYGIKQHKLRLRAADANGLINTRMYQNWEQVNKGFAKNILAGHANSLAFLVFSMIIHSWLFVGPWLWLALSLPFFKAPGSPNLAQMQINAVLLITLGIGTRALTSAFTRQRLRDALLMPISVILMTVISLQAIKWRFNGDAEWKGRRLQESHKPRS